MDGMIVVSLKMMEMLGILGSLGEVKHRRRTILTPSGKTLLAQALLGLSELAPSIRTAVLSVACTCKIVGL